MTSERSSLFFFKKKRVVLYRNYSYISDAVFTKLSLWHMHAVACHQSFTFPITCDSEENKSYLLDNLVISRPGAIIFTAKLHYLADLVGWRGAFVRDDIRQAPINIICMACSLRKKSLSHLCLRKFFKFVNTRFNYPVHGVIHLLLFIYRKQTFIWVKICFI